MRIKDKIYCAYSILKSRILNVRIPLAVRWQLTNKCTLRCKYCNIYDKGGSELGLSQVKDVLCQLKGLGTKRISFSGGDVLLRDDFSEILDCCIDYGIYPELNCNGVLFYDKAHKLKKLDFVKFSLDGPKQVHDSLRGDGSFDKVMKSVEACLKNKIKFGFAMTLTKFNINDLDFLLQTAKKYETIVAFQPVKSMHKGIEGIDEFLGSEEVFRKALKKLILEKGRGCENIRNSMRELKYIYDWPNLKEMKCYAGQIFCIIGPDGDVYPCDRVDGFMNNTILPNCQKLGIEEAIRQLPEFYCKGCGFCGALELNHLMNFKFGVLKSIKRIIS
ncbi:MAG: radical SAM protein [Candidatus Omnitrophica bacterium]|nr:radical SAM protein [Candidatus Omnitrophota bacterium]